MEYVEDTILGECVNHPDDVNTDEHSWVQWYQRSWLSIEEAENGVLVNPQVAATKYIRPPPEEDSKSNIPVKKGLIRFLYLIIDFSEAMKSLDYKPNRVDFLIAELCNNFIPKFFESNPLSYISILVMRDGEAHFITRMNGQPKFQVKKLKEYAIAHNPSGTCSVVRAIDLVLKSSLDSPLYASKEILLVWGSLVSVDPIETPINPYLTDKIQNQSITIISISPEVHALKKLSEVGPGNKFIVATSQTDFTSRLSEYINPRINTQVKPVYVKMGFPMKTSDTTRLVKCVCHKEMQSSVYVCPQCQGFVCEIPTNCPVCKLTLVDKDMLTRVHRLLYSMPTYTVIPAQVQTADMHPTEMAHICFGCDSYFTEGGAVCDACGEKFCYECDMFAHDSLKHCPGCLTAPTGDR